MPTIPNRCHIFRPAENDVAHYVAGLIGAPPAQLAIPHWRTSGDISNEKEKLLIQRRGFIVSIHNFQTKHPQEQNASCCPTNMSAPIYLCIDVSMYRCSYVPVYLFIYLPTYISTYLSIHPSIHFSISISISTS